MSLRTSRSTASSLASRASSTFVGILLEAAYSGRVSLVQQLLDDGADVNAEGGFNGTALQAAAYGGQIATVELLLQRGVDVDAVSGFYGTALQAAAYGDHEEIVKILLDANADINMQGGQYGTALRAAAYKGHEAIVQLLLGKGADVNAQITDLDELSRESGSALQAAAREGHEAVVQILIDQGAEVNGIGGYFGTALQAAASEGHEDVIQLLLDSGADVNAIGGEFGTALQAAACEGHEEVVQFLIDNGADVNIEGGEFGSALEAADCEGHETVVQILLENGAEINRHGDHYTATLQAAVAQNHPSDAPTDVNSQNELNALRKREASIRRRARRGNDGSSWSSTVRSSVIESLPELSHGPSIISRNDNNGTIFQLRERIQHLDMIEVTPERMTEQTRELEKVMSEKKSAEIHEIQTSYSPSPPRQPAKSNPGRVRKAWRVLRKFGKFIGPGYMIAVGYIDPGNFSTDVSAGSAYEFKLLFVILLSNLCAIFLQSLCVKLGTLTGLNLAEHCREHLPRWLNYFLYFLAESAIIATDVAEVIGSAIALNILLHVPLVAGCALTLVDVLVILIFYNPNGSTRHLRYFEYFVMSMVLGIMVCFFIQLSYMKGVEAGEVFKGYLPSSALIQSNALYLSCGILGATVMPHNLYLGSGVVQARLHEFDVKEGNLPARPPSYSSSTLELKYRPSLSAIRNCMSYSIAELVIALLTFAFFVNSAILITAGASLDSATNVDPVLDADLFGIHDLLTKTFAPAAGTIFAVSLLLSGTSAGVVATIAGQMISEGALRWTCAPWMRRLFTRSISIVPSIIVAGAVGRDGLVSALNASQITLSAILPFVSAPLIYFTCRNKYMTVSTADGGDIKMRNHWFTTTLAIIIWLTIVIMNVSLVILFALGKICGLQGCIGEMD